MSDGMHQDAELGVTVRGRLTEELARHEYDVCIGGTVRPACKCGWVADREWSSTDVYDLHVADSILASDWLSDQLAHAWDEGYRCDWTGGVSFDNPYRTTPDQHQADR